MDELVLAVVREVRRGWTNQGIGRVVEVLGQTLLGMGWYVDGTLDLDMLTCIWEDGDGHAVALYVAQAGAPDTLRMGNHFGPGAWELHFECDDGTVSGRLPEFGVLLKALAELAPVEAWMV